MVFLEKCASRPVSVKFFFFFFQAEDGIRDKLVTGVQTCALPISWVARLHGGSWLRLDGPPWDWRAELEAGLWEGGNARGWECLGNDRSTTDTDSRSEERRVGKECRSRWSPYH